MAERQAHAIDEITCREFVELVTDYLERRLATDRLDLVEEHLVMCDWCKTYLDQMEVVVKALPAADDEPVPERTERVLVEAFREWKARR